jgi:predicted secreted protein
MAVYTGTQAKQAYGAQLLRNNGSAYAAIEELTAIGGPSSKTKPIDCTNFDSGGVNEYISGLLDSGTVTCEGNFVNGTNQALAYDDFNGRTTSLWEITLPGTQPAAGYFRFSAMVIEFAPDFKLTEQVKFKLTLQITGAITFGTT